MKIIFMGTPDFSVGTFQALLKAGHDIVLAVTQPDKPKGRGKEVQYSPVKEVALAAGIPVYQPTKIRQPESVDYLQAVDADIMVVIAFGQILPKEILEMTPYGCINVHASLLPKYRGAAPIQWSILNGETITGVTTMQMDEGLDTGDMIDKVEVAIESGETGGSLHDKLSEAGARLCVQTLEKLENHTATFEKQGDSPTDYAKMLDKKMGKIDWNRPAVEIERLIRGLSPWPSAYTFFQKKNLKIWEAECVAGESQKLPGTVTAVSKRDFTVQTGRGQLKIQSLQLAGKKRLDCASFMRGYQINIDDIIGGE